MSKFPAIIFFLLFALSCICCKQQKQEPITNSFTHEDSLTERYLLLHDSLLHCWNVMITDDNIKIKAMEALLHEFKMGNYAERSEIQNLSSRIEQLPRIRFTEKTLSHHDLIEEYDFASSSIVIEIIALAKNSPYYEVNSTLQKLSDSIMASDKRIPMYRNRYDKVAKQYNSFLQSNEDLVKSLNHSTNPKPVAIFTSEIE